MTNLFWIMLLATLIVVVGFILLIRKKKRVFAALLLILGVAAWFGYKEYTRSNRDLTDMRPDITIVASALIKEYEANDSLANKKFLGKIIETTGTIQEVKKDESGFYTIALGENGSLSAVRCAVDTNHLQDASLLTAGTSVQVRGACTGFLKDEMGLGSDVILNRCIILSNKKK